MPLYDYKCTACGSVREVRHGFNETHDEPCPECGSAMTRVFNAAPIVFKGSGFYVTDSRPSGSKPAAKTEAAKSDAPKSDEAKADAPKADAPKSDSKGESAA